MKLLPRLVSVTATLCLSAFLALAAGSAPPGAGVRLPERAELGAAPDQLLRGLGRVCLDPWRPEVNEDRTRGVGVDVYPRVAPAVVVVRTGKGHGTGAVIDPAGWVITNHHVIAAAATDANGAQKVTVHFGQLDGDFMRLIDDAVPGRVFKASEEKDLALIKLDRVPKGFDKLLALQLAKEPVRPGADCVAIGHPGAGTLWSVRSGEVAGAGHWPKDMTEIITGGLAPTARERERLSEMLASTAQRRVLISTCGINFGDSGGPLVNTRGELIAVTFAMPKPEDRGTAKFSYHVHLDEVKSFLAEKPKAPEVRVPDPWPEGVYAALMDLDDDGTPDTLAYALSRGQPPTGMLMDLKQESDPNLKASDLRNPARRKDWHFQFAIQRAPQARAFYDTDDDGKIDLILTDSRREGVADTALRLKNGTWVRESAEGRPLIDPTLISNKNLRKRFVKITRRLQREGTDE